MAKKGARSSGGGRGRMSQVRLDLLDKLLQIAGPFLQPLKRVIDRREWGGV